MKDVGKANAPSGEMSGDVVVGSACGGVIGGVAGGVHDGAVRCCRFGEAEPGSHCDLWPHIR